jgi:phage terminase large subunit-like protein
MPRPPKRSNIETPGQAFSHLAEKLKLQATRPNIYGYRPHAKQVAFHSSPAKGRLYIGGNRSGKTTGGIAEDIMWLTGKHPYRVVPPAPIAGRIVSVDFLNGIEKIIRPELARWLPPSELLGGSWYTAYNRELRTLTLENGSFVEFMSYDQDLDKFAGTSRDFIHFDEEPPQDIWLENKTRLIDRGGSYWITMTPVEGMTWVFDDIYMPGKNNPSMGLSVTEVDMTENPYLHSGEVDEFVSGLSDDDREARVHGKFVQLGGLIFKGFDPSVHVIDPIVPPKSWEWYVSIDHGYNNPTAILWHAVDPDNRVITFAEHYVSGEIVDWHTKAIHEKNSSLGRMPDQYIGDPAMGQHNGVSGTSIIQEYAANGIGITPGENDVVSGINRVARYLEIRGDGKPSWYITRNCTNLIYEMQRYKWKTYTNRKAMRQNNAREQPHKKEDHAIDSARYFFMARPELGPNKMTRQAVDNPLGLASVKPFAVNPEKYDRFAGEEFQRPQSTEWNISESDEFMGIY